MEMRKQINDTMRRILCTCMAWLGLGLALQAQTSTLTTQAAAIAQGREAALHVTLTNGTEISGGQFAMTLPEGITVKQVSLNEERSNGHTLEYRINGNSVHVLFYAQPTAPLKGTEGTLCMLTLAAATDMASDEYKVTFSEVRLAVDATTPAEVTATEGTLAVTARYMVNAEAGEGGSVEGGGLFDAGDPVTLTATPHEGYHFEQWSDGSTANPYTFEAEGHVTLTARFAPNTYEVIYVIDGVEYKRESVLYGSKVSGVDAPAKEGYTFSGWTGLPDTMPAEDVTVTGSYLTNGYTVTFMLEGEVYHTETVAYGATVPTPEAPTREGYTFSGWQGLPETMPAEDITITGTFTVNGYTVTFMLEGEVYHTETVTYGAAVPAPEEPVKEGHTFGGWQDVPEAMPAEDITITGHFTANEYTVIYMVEGETYRSVVYTYGTAVTPEAEPTKEGHTFSGWQGVPETMPAGDVTVTGHFTVNAYLVTYTVEGEVYHTDSVAYGAAVVAPEEPVKEGYTFGGWQGVPEAMPAEDITVTGAFVLNAEQTDAQGVTYILNTAKDGFEVSGYTESLQAEVVIPESLYGLPVKAVRAKAFYGAEAMEAVSVPASAESVGAQAFGGCAQLLVVEWHTAAALLSDCFDEPSQYGNMLVYVSDPATETAFEGNVIIDGVAEQITLIDGMPLRNIQPFTARTVSYSRTFTKQTPYGEAGGWEAMVLPFDVQRVVSETKGELKPFGEADFITSLPYWLAELQENGTFVAVHTITANKPFIMQLPNSEEYEEQYNVTGIVTFSAENATVCATTGTAPTTKGYTLQGSYEGTAAARDVYALNEEVYTADGETFQPGGVFVADSRDIRPFEAYVYSNHAAPAPYLRIGGKGSTGIGHSTLKAQPSAIYDLMGRKLLKSEMLEKGIYIVNGKLNLKN